MNLNFLESFHQLEYFLQVFFLQNRSNWLKNRKNLEFVVSEMVVGIGEQDLRTQLWLLHSCYLGYLHII